MLRGEGAYIVDLDFVKLGEIYKKPFEQRSVHEAVDIIKMHGMTGYELLAADYIVIFADAEQLVIIFDIFTVVVRKFVLGHMPNLPINVNNSDYDHKYPTKPVFMAGNLKKIHKFRGKSKINARGIDFTFPSNRILRLPASVEQQ